MKELHLIIDGPNLVHRAYWVSSLKKKNDTNFHLFIFLRSIKCLVEQFHPTRIWCAWDHRIEKNSVAIRKELNEDYKASRDTDRNKNVHEKTDILIDLLDTLGITNIQPLRGEADDIIAHIARNVPDKKIIVSADHDLLQLITDETSIYSPIKKKTYDIHQFYREFGMSPCRFALFKSIKGDRSDNIEGLYKFGNKKALKVINGDLSLTKEQEDKITQNLKLISLDEKDDDDWLEEYKYYNNIIAQPLPDIDFNKFIKKCEELDLESIYYNQATWHSLFFVKSTMENILFKLFKD